MFCRFYLLDESQIHYFLLAPGPWPGMTRHTPTLATIILGHHHLETSVASSLVFGFHSCPPNLLSPHSQKDLLEVQI